MNDAVHLNLDGAWEGGAMGLPEVAAREWGPRLRYCAPRTEVEAFYDEMRGKLAPFVLYGSGDFHYLAGVFLRRVARPVTVVSFDNHPDWDIRPPYWGCGGWVNRALESGLAGRVSVWGCGNFELRFPSRLFANRAALRNGRLEVHAWAERQDEKTRRRFDCMTRGNWRERFEGFAERLAGGEIYVTVDMDCFCAQEAATNWENGLFTAGDVAWAIGLLREKSRVVGGDVCGAYSPPAYARWGQRFAGNWDHPKVVLPARAQVRDVNMAALKAIWPVLAGHWPR